MARSANYTAGKFIELEIMNFLHEFSGNLYQKAITALLFPPGLPLNMQRAIRYVAMLFNLVGIQVGPETAQTVLVVRRHHLRPPYDNINNYFSYEDADPDNPYVYEQFRDMLKSSFIRHITKQKYQKQFMSILEVMRGSHGTQTQSADESVPSTSGYNNPAPTTSGYNDALLSTCSEDESTQSSSDYSETASTLSDHETASTASANEAVPPIASEEESASNNADCPSDDKPTATTSTDATQNKDTVKPSAPPGLNVNAKEFIPSLNPRNASMENWTGCKYVPKKDHHVVFTEDQIKEVQQYVGCDALIVVAGQNYDRFITGRAYNMDYVLELYNLPPRRWINSIRETYTEEPFYLKFLQGRALLVGRSIDQAQRLLKIKGGSIKARPFKEASPLSVLIAYYARLAPAKLRGYL